MEERKKCSECEYYSYTRRRCILGKVNPRSFKRQVETARFMGVTSICGDLNTWERIVKKLKEEGA